MRFGAPDLWFRTSLCSEQTSPRLQAGMNLIGPFVDVGLAPMSRFFGQYEASRSPESSAQIPPTSAAYYPFLALRHLCQQAYGSGRPLFEISLFWFAIAGGCGRPFTPSRKIRSTTETRCIGNGLGNGCAPEMPLRLSPKRGTEHPSGAGQSFFGNTTRPRVGRVLRFLTSSPCSPKRPGAVKGSQLGSSRSWRIGAAPAGTLS